MATDVVSAAPAPRRLGIRRILSWARVALAVGVLVFWFVDLRPPGLGGPASYALVSGKSMLPRYRAGDVVIVHRHSQYRVGEVIAYTARGGQVGAGAQVLDRIVGGNGSAGFVVRGDNRATPDVWRPRTADVVGSAWVRIPRLAGVVRRLHTPLVLAGLAAAIAIASVLLYGFRRARKEQPALPEAAAGPEPPLATPAAAIEPAALPALDPHGLRGRVFETRFRGYDRSQVREALDRLASDLEQVIADVARLRAQRDELAARSEQQRLALIAELEDARRAHLELLQRFESLERDHAALDERAAAFDERPSSSARTRASRPVGPGLASARRYVRALIRAARLRRRAE